MAKKAKTKRQGDKKLTGKSKKSDKKVSEDTTADKMKIKEKKTQDQTVTDPVEIAEPEEKQPSADATKKNKRLKFNEVLYKPLDVIYERFHLNKEISPRKKLLSYVDWEDIEENAENESSTEIEITESRINELRENASRIIFEEPQIKKETSAQIKLRERQRKKSVAFGVIRQDEGTEVDGYTWMFDHVVKSAMSEKQQERNKHLMRPLLKPIHPRCIPVYSHRPTLSRAPKKKKKTKKERQDWLFRLSRPKKIPSEPVMKIRRHTKPRTAKERREWYLKNSRPKVVKLKCPPQINEETDKPKRTYEEMLPRLIELSRPKRINKRTPPPDHVDRTSLKYQATDRIVALAQPRSLNPEYVKDLEYNFDDKMERALRYRTSERMEKLAEPRIRTEPYQRTVEDPDASAFQVKSGALQYKPTKRILKLAEPRIYEKEEPWDPYEIKPSALRYTLTARMLELSKPKGDPREFQHNCFKDLY